MLRLSALCGFFLGALVACSTKTALPVEGSSGFVVDKDAFRFQNFATDYDAAQLNTKLMVRMFGAVNVCRDSAANAESCVLTPNAEAWMDSANNSMQAGHCEGFAVLAQLFHLGELKATDFGGNTVRELSIEENYKLQRELAYWFATQLVPDAAVNKTLMPNEVVPFLAEFLKEAPTEFYRIGMVQKDQNGFGVAHSLTPIGFVRGESENTYYIRVYDNNFPAVERQIRLDLDANEWAYTGVTTTGPIEFKGGTANKNPLYFAASKSRLGELPCPFCGPESFNLTVTGAMPLVKDSNGETGFKDGELVTAANTVISPGFSGCTQSGATVMISSSNGASGPVAVVLAPNGSAEQSVKIQGGSIGTVAVSGDLATSTTALLQATGDSVSIQSTGERTQMSFQVGDTVVTVVVTGDAGNVKVSRDPVTGAVGVETMDGAQGGVTITLDNKSTGSSTSYEVEGSSGTAKTTINLPKDGWTSATPPAASQAVNGASSAVPGSLCTNLAKDLAETDIDCGGSSGCGQCGVGKTCNAAIDCLTDGCQATNRTCVARHLDGIKSGLETDIDCGGDVAAGAPRCAEGKTCTVGDWLGYVPKRCARRWCRRGRNAKRQQI
jgi:hypothetical protein